MKDEPYWFWSGFRIESGEFIAPFGGGHGFDASAAAQVREVFKRDATFTGTGYATIAGLWHFPLVCGSDGTECMIVGAREAQASLTAMTCGGA